MLNTFSIIGLIGFGLLSTVSEAYQREDTDGNQEIQSGTSAKSSIEPEPIPIVVLGAKKEEREKVVLGSRIPREPLFDSKTYSVATSTGTPGFTPGSGMDDAAGGTRRVTISTCEASDSAISAEVACALIAAKEAIGKEEWNIVRGYLIPLSENDQLSRIEHRAIADYLYISAQKSGSASNKIEALKLLIGTQTLSQIETGNALRGLASLYLAAEEEELAISTLEKAVQINPNDQRALENLSILRKNGAVSIISQTTNEP